MSSVKFPYSLGYENNPVLPKYQKNFQGELILAWRKCLAYLGSPKEMVSYDESDLEFFFSIPEISTNLLHFIDSKAGEQELAQSSSIIQSEFLLYLSGGYEHMKSYTIKKIPGTNILLGPIPFALGLETRNTHPDHDTMSVSSLFGNVSEEDWFSLYEKSFSILKRVDVGFFSEMSGLLKKIVPFGVSDGCHNSCSHGDIIGVIYSSYPIGYENPDIAVMEALIHEYNHNKMNLIMRADGLIRNERITNYYSPYRPDARHIHGIYLGLHAMVAVYYIMLKCFLEDIIPRESNFFRKTIVYVLKNQLAINTLKHYGVFTPLGEEIFQDMQGLHHESLAMIRALKIEKGILEDCKKSTSHHFYKALSENRILYY